MVTYFEKQLGSNSAWDAAGITRYLQRQESPLRLACNGKSDYPLLCSLWFQVADNAIWCASHESSKIVAALQNEARCAFEVSSNEMPYKGVRGQGDVRLHRASAAELLEQLMARYLGEENAELASWLRSRADGEYAIEIRPRWISAWDYGHRMRAAATGQ